MLLRYIYFEYLYICFCMHEQHEYCSRSWKLEKEKSRLLSKSDKERQKKTVVNFLDVEQCLEILRSNMTLL